MKLVTIYTDGSCLGNPGPGGWCATLQYNNTKKIISGNLVDTTNNAMELTAAIRALSALKTPCDVELYTDSKYLQNGISSWIFKWKKNNWKGSSKQEIKNIELWQEIDTLCQTHRVAFKWVKAHSGDKNNEEVNDIAQQEAKKLKV